MDTTARTTGNTAADADVALGDSHNVPFVTASDTQLPSGAIGLTGALMQSITCVGPAVGLFFSVQYLASLSGVAVPFAFLVVVFVLATTWTYVMADIGNFRYFYRERHSEFNWFLHLACPIIGTAAIAWVVYKSLVPLPAAPVKYAPIIVGAWVVLGLCVLAVMRFRGREEWLLPAGKAAQEHVETAGELSHRPVI
jgi:amino acid transporter